MSAHQFESNSTRFAAPGTTANVYVSGLPERYNDYQLRSLFEQFGKVESAKMMCYSANSNKPRGTGFVLFDNSDSPVAAVTTLNKSVIEGQTIEVCFAKAHRQDGERQPKKHTGPHKQPVFSPPTTTLGTSGGFQVQGFDNPVTFQQPRQQPSSSGFAGPKKIMDPPQYPQQPNGVVVVQQVIQPDGQIVYLVPAAAATGPTPPLILPAAQHFTHGVSSPQ